MNCERREILQLTIGKLFLKLTLTIILNIGYYIQVYTHI